MTSAYTGERRGRLQALAELLPAYRLVSRMVGDDHAVLWVWQPQSGRQTLVFATPAHRGWLFLWSPGGQCRADEPELAAQALKEALESAEPG